MPELPQAEIDALGGFRLIAGQYGGTPQSILKKIQELEEDNRKYRQETIPGIEAKVPKEGFVIVAKADAELLVKFKELGDTPAKVKAALEAGQTAQGELQLRVLKETASAFAKAAGLATESVETLIAIPQLKDAKFEVRKGKVANDKNLEVDGEVAYITLTGENEKAMTFTDALEKVPALKGLARAGTAQQPSPGVSFVQQGTPGGPAGTIYDQIRARAKAAQETPKDAPKAPSVEERLGMRPTQ